MLCNSYQLCMSVTKLSQWLRWDKASPQNNYSVTVKHFTLFAFHETGYKFEESCKNKSVVYWFIVYVRMSRENWNIKRWMIQWNWIANWKNVDGAVME
jgi:hypothetical protein